MINRLSPRTHMAEEGGWMQLWKKMQGGTVEKGQQFSAEHDNSVLSLIGLIS